MVFQRQCPPPPNNDWTSYPKNRDQCGKPIGRPERGPYPIDKFRGVLTQELEREQLSLNNNLKTLNSQRAELQAQINNLNKLIDDPNTNPDLRKNYQKMVNDLGKQDEVLVQQKNFAESKLNEISKSIGMISNVVIKQMLASKLVHPVVKGSELFNETRPFVKEFDNSFKRMAGQVAGDNTWTDAQGKRFWRYIPGQKTLAQAKEACAYLGMSLPGDGKIFSDVDQSKELLKVVFAPLDSAYIYGLTKMDWPIEGVDVWTSIGHDPIVVYAKLRPSDRELPIGRGSEWCTGIGNGQDNICLGKVATHEAICVK